MKVRFLTVGTRGHSRTALRSLRSLRAVRSFCQTNKQTNILKLTDLITFHVSLFMFKFHNRLLPAVFDNYFISTSKVHNYNTRLSSQLACSLPRVRTNYGKFNIKFSGSKVWNSLSSDLKLLSIGSFKARIKSNLISRY